MAKDKKPDPKKRAKSREPSVAGSLAEGIKSATKKTGKYGVTDRARTKKG